MQDNHMKFTKYKQYQFKIHRNILLLIKTFITTTKLCARAYTYEFNIT